MATSKRRVSIEDFAKITVLSDARMSPDGGHVLFGHKTVGEKNQYTTTLWVACAEAAPPRGR
jgi:hypothetical protein